jgi:small subunit ribosomal protein S20
MCLANTKSAQKKIRADERKQAKNKVIRSKTRTLVTRARKAIADNPEAEAEKDVLAALSTLDKAASKGIVHPNNAARRKSRC